MEVEIEGTVVVQADDGKSYTVEWINFDNRAWLVPLWSVSDDDQWILPVRLIAPALSPGQAPIPGVEVLRLLGKAVPLPISLLENAAEPAEVPPLLDILEGPRIFSRNPNAGAH